LCWIAVRLTTVGTAFLIVASLFHAMSIAPATLLALAMAVLMGLAFSASILAYAATLKNGKDFNVLFRFVVTPLFMFSGVFFPIDRLAVPLQWIAQVSPLYHGVQLVRGLTLGALSLPAAAIHLTYLLLLLIAGFAAARSTFRRKLYA
jgi:lipooligosaccharide transport system permease protein